MKTLPNTPFTSLQGDDGKDITYKDMMVIALEKPPKGGIDIATMRKHIKILDALDTFEGKDEIELADDDALTVLGAVNDLKWGKMDAEIVTFVDDLTEACK